MWLSPEVGADIPLCYGVPMLSGGWSCLAQGLGRAWEAPWEREHPGCSVPLSRVCLSLHVLGQQSPWITKSSGCRSLLPTCLAGLQPELGVGFSLPSIPIIHCGLRLWVGKETMRRNVFWSPTSSYQGYK